MTFEAELVRGKTYFLGEKVFNKGVRMSITEKEMAHLKEYAVDPVRVEGKNEFRQKFKFHETTPAEEPKPTRQRKKVAKSD